MSSATDTSIPAEEPPARHGQDANLFRLLVEHVLDYAIFLLTPDGCVASWNAGAARLKQFTAEEIIGQHFSRFYTPEDQAIDLPNRLLGIARTEGRVEKEGWRVRKDGTRFWADVVITALRDDQGVLVGFAKVTRDLTERRQAEQERATRLAAERAAERINRLQAATAALSTASRPQQVAEVLAEIGVTALGAELGVVAFPTAAGTSLEVAAVHGSAEDEPLTGRRLATDHSSPLSHVWRTAKPLFLASRDRVPTEYPALAEHLARARHAAWAAVPLLVEQRVAGVLGLAFARPQAFDAEQRGVLLALAEVGAQALHRAEIYEAERHARDEAEAAVRAQDEFLSIASHELRTPVAAVKASAQFVQRAIRRGTFDPARAEYYLASITRAADRLGTLIDDLLDVSRLRTGRLRLRWETVDLGAIVQEGVARYRSTEPTRQFVLRLPSTPIHVPADPVRLEQVLDNFLSNAVKYSPEGGAITIVLQAEDDGATLTVTDQGIGLPAGQEAQIFRPFGRAENAADQQIPGLGLGLAICRQLVEAHGGHIWATSPGENQGTTVGIWLPGSMAAPPEAPDTA